ncbi:MAG: thiol peroxidase [Phycisphaeraceae bacterium]|nr:thiol peroxidase [Phycisphaeraceae bacterium]
MKRVMVCGVAAVLATIAGCAASQRATERTGLVTMRGTPLTLQGVGPGAQVGKPAPDFVAIANDMSERSLQDYRGKTVILATIPSLETAVCDAETRAFNERASALDDSIIVVTVSMDLPFTQKKWCAAAGIDRVETLSDSRLRQVGDNYALRIKENGLLARSVTVIDGAGIVRYQEIVPELSREPDYDSAIKAARAASDAR